METLPNHSLSIVIIMRVLIKNQQKSAKLDRRKISRDSKKILGRLGLDNAELSILLLDDLAMKDMNARYRGKDKPTDVLSFPQEELSAISYQLSAKKSKVFILGDIVINIEAAKRQAPEHGLSFMEEMRWLLIHGILHLIGYDHEKSKYAERKMREKEKEFLDYLEEELNAC
mgnify:CR=1 FL=1